MVYNGNPPAGLPGLLPEGRRQPAEVEVWFLQPEIEYVYELQLDPDTKPRPGDSEVEEFYLWGVGEVKAALLRGEFKHNSAIVVIDFFIRHGIVTAENERDYAEIVWRLYKRLQFPAWV
ncbi:hypothetical protein BJX63DRAFT_436311 [Aspergillus granulosus]|uniref:Uncharacterized protein n=1 Tax=Aspergillus granulosus TaxID=176169 RepID=A0ABR4H037_9EURO